VDVATGNALFTDQLLSLPGVRGAVPVTLSYNSSVFGTSTPSAVTGTNGSGWSISGFDERMVTNSDSSVTFYGPGGLTGVFASSGSGFTSPSQFQATLTGSASSGYTLTDHGSQEKLSFNSSGRLTTDTDRDGNVTTYAYNGSDYPASITSSGGPSGARTLTVTMSGAKISTLTQTSGYSTRLVSFGYTSGGHLSSVTDTAGGSTGFASAYGTDTGQVVTITNPMGKAATLTYSGSQVTQVAQSNPPIDHGAGTSTTRIDYASSSQTLVADPTTNQSESVSTVPHTTYNLTTDGSNLVSSATDPDGNQRSDTYTTLGNIASSSPAAGGSTSFTYGSNSGESLTNVAFPQGASDTAAYNNTGGSAYLPSSTTDDAGNALTSTYDSNGNQTGSQQGTSGPSASVTYNSNGTPATSASPGAGSGVTTNYTYDSNSDLTKITPPTGTSLGNRSYTYDDFGRLATATDGAGDTLTYTYDNLDRITKVAYSDGTPSVSYTYNKNGQITQRVDASGTTTYTYDDLGHLLSTSNSANGDTVSYTYDLAGAEATTTDAIGTTTYGYDAAHELTSMTYPQGTSTLTTEFANNANNQRTDVWLQSNSSHSVWAAHEHYTYDSSGRITAVLGQDGSATAPTTVVNETLCYAANSTAPSCSTATSNDRSNVQWTSDTVSGETNTYTYDTTGRLTKDVVTGGSNPRTYTYGYDSAGNRTSAAVTGSSPSSQSLTYNNGNQISSSGYSYDGAGDLTTSPTRTATFNAAGQQTSATVSGVKTTYTYAGTNQNELISESTPGGQTYKYSYGAPDQNGIPQIDSITVGTTGGSTTGTGYVLHDPSGQPIMLQTNSSVTCLYLYDGTGNPVALSTSFNTTAIALRYDPYGAATRTDGGGGNGAWTENPYEFGEGMQDRVTGELKFGARWYSPTSGGWTQQDALNAPLDPSNANRYEYAADNPINDADHTGLWSLSISGCIASLCAQVNVGSSSSGGLSVGGGVGVGTGDDGSGESFGASYSSDDLDSGPYASASCSYGDSEVGVDATESGVSSDAELTTPSSGECSGFVGGNT
jgi:RHS repeat-associated protein